MVSLNHERIAALSQALLSMPLPPDFRQRFVPMMTSDEETARLALLWVAAICHSTKGGLLGRFADREVKGTEYLLAAFCAAANQDPLSISVASVKILDEGGLRLLLTRFIQEPKVTLSDLARRAEMLRVLAEEIDQYFEGRVSTLLDRAHQHVGGENGFYASMDHFSSFQDPLKKKSGVFLYFLEVSGRWQFTDPDQVVPMIDYHVIRLLCRTGCIEIADESLKEKLSKRELATAEEERILREAAFQARLALTKTFDVPERGELLYLLGRSYCRNTPVCVSGHAPESDSFNLYTQIPFQGQCPFQAWCPGACQRAYRDIWEPVIQTENY
jgi:hypothetical protein